MIHPYDDHGDDARDAMALEAMLSEGTISRRIVACLIDSLFISMISASLFVVLFVFGVFTFGLGFPLLKILPFVAPAYNWLFLMSSLGATPGQALIGMTLRNADDLSPPTPIAALIWTVGFYASLALWGLPLLLAFFNPRRRTAHDMISGLVVVRSRALTGWLGTWNISSGGPPAA
jgi:uncharacterized RDD family membrane protein YckC